jgi:antitoxin (DNA-binding transcriptional repressor) of toxin-antitoxin stability system
MKTVNIHEAKTHFSALIADVADGEEIVIAKAGKPVAKLSRIGREDGQRVLGQDAALDFWIADDFDAYVPEEFAEFA